MTFIPKLAAHSKWVVQSKIVVEKPKGNRLSNLIDLIRVIKFTDLAINRNVLLKKSNVYSDFTKLANAALKIDAKLPESSFLKISIKIITFLITGTTLFNAIEKLRYHAVTNYGIKNDYAAKLKYSQLMNDADAILNGKSPSKEYLVPSTDWRAPNIPLLYHINREICVNWKAIAALIKKGKALDDPAVMALCDATMQLGEKMGQLMLEKELDECYQIDTRYDKKLQTEEEIKPKLMLDQRHFIWISYITFSNFYHFIRSNPEYDSNASVDKRWIKTAQKDNDSKFFISGTQEHSWRAIWNGFMDYLYDEVDVAAMQAFDERCFIDYDKKDGKDTYLKEYIYGGNSPYINYDYLESSFIGKHPGSFG